MTATTAQQSICRPEDMQAAIKPLGPNPASWTGSSWVRLYSAIVPMLSDLKYEACNWLQGKACRSSVVFMLVQEDAGSQRLQGLTPAQ